MELVPFPVVRALETPDYPSSPFKAGFCRPYVGTGSLLWELTQCLRPGLHSFAALRLGLFAADGSESPIDSYPLLTVRISDWVASPGFSYLRLARGLSGPLVFLD